MIHAVKRSRRSSLLRLLPFYGLIAGAVFLRGHVHFLAERLPQVALGREMHVLRDLGDGLVGIPQEICGPLDPHLHDIVLQTDPGVPLEEPREVGGADPQLLRDIIEIQLEDRSNRELRDPDACLAFIKNDAKPVIIKCWQRNSETEPEVIPVDEITDISGFDSSRVDMSYNPITEEWKDWSMTPDGQPYFDDE